MAAFTRFHAPPPGEGERFYKADQAGGALAWTKTARDTAIDAQRRWRASLRRNGLGGFEKTIRVRHFPSRGASLRAASEVFSKAIYKRAGGLVDLVERYEEGFTIVAVAGRGYLAIPTKDVPRQPARGGSTRPATPSDFPPGSLRLVDPPGPFAFLVLVKNPDVRVFVLVPRVTVRGRPLRLQEESAAAATNMDARLVENWARATKVELAA